MFKRTRRIVALVLSLLMMVGLLAGCGTEGGTQEDPLSGTAEGSKTVVIRCNEGGFGVQWLHAMADAFEQAYKELHQQHQLLRQVPFQLKQSFS